MKEMRGTAILSIKDDQICENMPNEKLFSNLSYDSGVQPILVIPKHAQIIIDGSLEAECRKC